MSKIKIIIHPATPLNNSPEETPELAPKKPALTLISSGPALTQNQPKKAGVPNSSPKLTLLKGGVKLWWEEN